MNTTVLLFISVLGIMFFLWVVVTLRVRKGKLPKPEEVGTFWQNVRRHKKLDDEPNIRHQLFRFYTGIFLAIMIPLGLLLAPLVPVDVKSVADTNVGYYNRPGNVYGLLSCGGIPNGTFASLYIISQDPLDVNVTGIVRIWDLNGTYEIHDFNVTVPSLTKFYVNVTSALSGGGCSWIFNSIYATETKITVIYETHTEYISVIDAMNRGYNPYA